MTYRFILDDQYFRTIPGVMVEAREGTPLANQIGAVIKSYTDAEVAKVTDTVMPYKIENENGNLAGFMTLQVNTINQTAILYRQVLRPAFVQFSTEINAKISSFIQTNSWKPDYLF